MLLVLKNGELSQIGDYHIGGTLSLAVSCRLVWYLVSPSSEICRRNALDDVSIFQRRRESTLKLSNISIWYNRNRYASL